MAPNDVWQHWFEISVLTLMSLVAFIFTVCGIGLWNFMRDAKKDAKEGITELGKKFDTLSGSVTNICTQVATLVEKTAQHEKALDRRRRG